MKTIGREDFASLFVQSRARARLRINHNIHPLLSDPVQRLFNAIQPLSYVQPHRHLGVDAWEAFILIEGEGVALSFCEDGRVLSRAHLSMTGTRMVEIPPKTYHTVLALVPDTLFFEIKRGPYDPNQAKDFAEWAPTENDADAQACAIWFHTAQEGDMCDRSYF